MKGLNEIQKIITHVLWQSCGSTSNGIIGFVRIDNGFDITTYCGFIKKSSDVKSDAIQIARHGGKTPFDIIKIGEPRTIKFD